MAVFPAFKRHTHYQHYYLIEGVLADSQLSILLEHRLNPSNWLDNPRLHLWVSFIKHFFDSPLTTQIFGFGPGTLLMDQGQWLSDPRLANRTFAFLHNDFLELIWSYGLAGSLCLLAILLLSLKDALRSAKRTKNPVWIANVVLLLVAATMFYPLSLPYFIFLFGFFCAKRSDSPMPGTAKLPRLSWPRIVGAIVVLIGTFFMLSQRVQIELGLRQLVSREGSLEERLALKGEVQVKLRQIPAPLLYQRMVFSPRSP